MAESFLEKLEKAKKVVAELEAKAAAEITDSVNTALESIDALLEKHGEPAKEAVSRWIVTAGLGGKGRKSGGKAKETVTVSSADSAKVLDAITSKFQTTSVIAEAAGLKPKLVRAAIMELKHEGKVTTQGRPWPEAKKA